MFYKSNIAVGLSRWGLFSAIIVTCFVPLPMVAAVEGEVIAHEAFVQITSVLEQYGFHVRLELPPVRGAYGLFRLETKTIWINPAVFDLGIAKPTLVHETVHAVQSCAGEGQQLQGLNLGLAPPPLTRRFFLRYRTFRRHLEAEAYTIQVQPDSVERVIALLHQHCR